VAAQPHDAAVAGGEGWLAEEVGRFVVDMRGSKGMKGPGDH
jgi:hypothetical protein